MSINQRRVAEPVLAVVNSLLSFKSSFIEHTFALRTLAYDRILERERESGEAVLISLTENAERIGVEGREQIPVGLVAVSGWLVVGPAAVPREPFAVGEAEVEDLGSM